MTKKAFKMAVVFLLSLNGAILNAQVTIGENKAPETFSILELVSNSKGGLRLPQIESTAQRDEVFTNAEGFKTNELAHGLQIYNLETNCIEFWDGEKWRSSQEGERWFYMPSIVIDVTANGTFSRDLHLEYKKQFADTDDASTPLNSPTAGTALIKSDINAPNPFSKIYGANELYYYVTGYDATVFSDLSISPAGVLSYIVNAGNVSDATYMNIVFVVK